MRDVISTKLGYTELVYQRISKKLQLDLTKMEIEALVKSVVTDEQSVILRQGKNYYISNERYQITINASNYRVITASKLS